MNDIYDIFAGNFARTAESRLNSSRKIGAELKFPLVNTDGTAVNIQKVDALWKFLKGKGWETITDSLTGKITACRKKGKDNYTIASTETGFCKTEFSLAYVSNLFELNEIFLSLRETLREFSDMEDVYFLAYGIQPVTSPGKHLMAKQTRTSVWDKAFGANRILKEDEGDDVNIFTLNASSHVHIDVSIKEAVPAVNVLNGFSAAQIALTAHSNIWKGDLDAEYKCVNEKFWDWWIPDSKRVGVPERPFKDLRDYINTVSDFKPVYIKRNGAPLLLDKYRTFAEYYAQKTAYAKGLDGTMTAVVPSKEDIDIHNTCYWYNARLTRYYTVENRVNDQQPVESMLAIPALTAGLVSALPDASDIIFKYPWELLRDARITACKSGLAGEEDGVKLSQLASEMLSVAKKGLEIRGKGEEVFLKPLQERLIKGICPADETEKIFLSGGISELLAKRRL